MMYKVHHTSTSKHIYYTAGATRPYRPQLASGKLQNRLIIGDRFSVKKTASEELDFSDK